MSAMSLKFTAAHSSRISKSSPKNPLLRRSSSSSSSPFSNHPRKKISPQVAKKSSAAVLNNELFESQLEDHGLITVLATDLRLRDVAQFLRYISENMFDAIPERAGLGSVRIAEVLNYRKNLPPIITTAHVHALSRSPTSTEREIAALIQAGIVRKISIPGRGIGVAAIGESLVMMDRWVQLVRETVSLPDEVKDKYITSLRENPTAISVNAGHFLPHEVVELAKCGFLTSSSTSLDHPSMLRSDSSMGTLASLSTVGSRNASGSTAAVGGLSAIHDAGGGGLGRGIVGPGNNVSSTMTVYHFSLPSVGIYLRLLEAARAHLVTLLSKSKFKEAPKDLLRDRWDGGVISGVQTGAGGGLASTLLPAKTRKWKQFYGLRFEWILEECLGTGLVEIFDTGSVGHGVRLT